MRTRSRSYGTKARLEAIWYGGKVKVIEYGGIVEGHVIEARSMPYWKETRSKSCGMGVEVMERQMK